MTTRISRAAFACALLATTCLATPALAQMDPTLPPAPTRPAIDDNGVDLITGTFNLSHTDLTIGPAGPGGLSYTRHWTGKGWGDNILATITMRSGVWNALPCG